MRSVSRKAVSKIVAGINNMSQTSYAICKAGIIFSLVSLACALAVLLTAEDLSAVTYRQYMLVKELYYMPVAFMLLAAVGVALVEEYEARRKR